MVSKITATVAGITVVACVCSLVGLLLGADWHTCAIATSVAVGSLNLSKTIDKKRNRK